MTDRVSMFTELIVRVDLDVYDNHSVGAVRLALRTTHRGVPKYIPHTIVRLPDEADALDWERVQEALDDALRALVQVEREQRVERAERLARFRAREV